MITTARIWEIKLTLAKGQKFNETVKSCLEDSIATIRTLGSHICYIEFKDGSQLKLGE